MKVNSKYIKSKTTRFKDLNVGDVFNYCGCYYMVTISLQNDANAVYLGDHLNRYTVNSCNFPGKLELFDIDCTVNPCKNVELNVEEYKTGRL